MGRVIQRVGGWDNCVFLRLTLPASFAWSSVTHRGTRCCRAQRREQKTIWGWGRQAGVDGNEFAGFGSVAHLLWYIKNILWWQRLGIVPAWIMLPHVFFSQLWTKLIIIDLVVSDLTFTLYCPQRSPFSFSPNSPESWLYMSVPHELFKCHSSRASYWGEKVV